MIQIPTSTSGHSNLAHTLMAYVGVLLGINGLADQLRSYFMAVGVPERITSAVLGALGLLVTLRKAAIDSKNNSTTPTPTP